MEKKTILVVDDEEVIREFLTEVLSEDFLVSTATDGDEAIEQLSRKQFDLVITDMKMERVQGEEVVKYTKETYPSSEVIVISGYSSLYSVGQTINSGAFAFISKPFSIKELMNTVNKAVGF